jgi:hypothetical protein
MMAYQMLCSVRLSDALISVVELAVRLAAADNIAAEHKPHTQ